MDFTIGIELGCKEIRAGITDKKGKVLKKVIVSTEADKGRDVILANINKSIELVLKFKKFRKIPPIGVSIPGLVDHDKGIIEKTQSLPLKGINIKKILHNKFKTIVNVDNDGNCFILGEHTYGSAKNCTNVIGMIVGTGVGGGIIINKQLYYGNGQAGEFGQMSIKFNGMISNCGNDGSIEEYISRRGLMRLSESFGMRNVDGPEDILKKALKNDLNSISLFREMGVYLGIHVANLINAFDPEKIIIGGVFADAWNFFGPHLKEEAKNRALFKPAIIKGKLGKNAIMIGASVLVK